MIPLAGSKPTKYSPHFILKPRCVVRCHARERTVPPAPSQAVPLRPARSIYPLQNFGWSAPNALTCSTKDVTPQGRPSTIKIKYLITSLPPTRTSTTLHPCPHHRHHSTSSICSICLCLALPVVLLSIPVCSRTVQYSTVNVP